MNHEDLLSRIYYNYEGGPASFTGTPKYLFSVAKKENPGIKYNQVKEFLRRQKIYQITKKRPKGLKKASRPYLTSAPGRFIGQDTLYLPKNFGNLGFVILSVDIFSLRVSLLGLRTLNSDSAARAMTKCIADFPFPILHTVLDRGPEWSREYMAVAKRNGTKVIFSQDKSYVAEIMIRKVKAVIGRFMMDKTVKSIAHIVEAAQRTMNSTPSRSLGMLSPIEAGEKENWGRVLALRQRRQLSKKLALMDYKQREFRVGDVVRRFVPPKNAFEKEGTTPNFSLEKFVIASVVNPADSVYKAYKLASIPEGILLPRSYPAKELLLTSEDNDESRPTGDQDPVQRPASPQAGYTTKLRSARLR